MEERRGDEQLEQQAATSSLAAGLQVSELGQYDPLPQEVNPLGVAGAWTDQPWVMSRAKRL